MYNNLMIKLTLFIKEFFLKKKFVIGDINKNDITGALHKAWGIIFSNHTQGDYVEFGVYNGNSFFKSIEQYEIFKKWFLNQNKSKEKWRVDLFNSTNFIKKEITFHALDSFEGMPKNNENNMTFKENNFKSDYSKFESDIRIFLNKKIQIKIYKGFFLNTSQDLKKNLKNKKIAIANIDCDLYKSTYDALQIIKSYIQIGTILLFDDYNCFNGNINMGQKKAFNKYLKNCNHKYEKIFTYSYVGQAFIRIK
jgi:O-methyltransferase